ncbi:galanin peptides isoform X2 [Xenopus laevis]|uniref:Galanin peptides n=1 Tax=Xenopus laevis TaxID=8355 RepID=A0A8J0UYV9_XENLA|nr:galanin peptides isoform X2 [Xenopus laevis]
MSPGSTCCALLPQRKGGNYKQISSKPLKMHKCNCLLLVSLVLCATISQTFGLVLTGKEKRGWTLNSAGYLLGPRRIEQISLIKDIPMGREESPGEYAVDNHRSFSDKHGAGKRDLLTEEDTKSGNFIRTLTDENVIRTLIEFLTYLHLKDSGVLDNLNTPMSSEETNQ